VLLWVGVQSLWPLRQQCKKIAAFARHVAGSPTIANVVCPDERVLQRAWSKLATRSRPTGRHEAVEPYDLFAADVLIPHPYNGRLDAAAPGIFTALGIVGTFLGLILAFSQIDPAQSEASIAPLVGGMTIAFVNSLLGVFLSIVWTVHSRRARHAFDAACADLAEAVETRIGHITAGDQLLQAFARLDDKLDSMLGETRLARQEAMNTAQAHGVKLDDIAEATTNSSAKLLGALVPQLENAFKTLVDTPFEKLTATVEQFRATVDEVAERHGYVLEALDTSVAGLGAAQHALAMATTDAAGCVQQFEAVVERISEEGDRAASVMAAKSIQAASALEAQTDRAGAIMEQANSLAVAFSANVGALRASAERQGEVASTLADIAEGLGSSSAELNNVSTVFGASAQRLEAAVGQIRQLGHDAALDTARAAREEMQAAIVQMSESLRDFGAQNIVAYETSSRGVIEAVDNSMSDLTERLSAELNTLMVRLPDVAATMTSAAKQVRAQIANAVRGLDDAVRQLDVSSNQSLKTRLEEYDGAVAKAVDHFSGTLVMWDGKVSELTGAVRRLEATAADKSKWFAGEAPPGVETIAVMEATVS